MSIQNPTEISQLSIGGVDRKDDAIRIETWRSVNSVGVWKAALHNINGQYNNTFDVQDQLLIDINGLANTLMQGRADGPAVTLQGADANSIWDEYVIVGGYDEAQDLLFHNDFDYIYSNPAQLLDAVLTNVITVQLAGLTNITYAPVGGTPAVGSMGFRRGTNFLATLQEMFQRVEYLFYVDDVLALQIGTPSVSASGVTLNSVAGDTDNNILGTVEFKRRDGSKLYNKIWVYGKTPQFDAYTEYCAARWATLGGGWAITDETVTIAPVTGNAASVRMDHTAPPALNNAWITLDFSQMLQDEVDMSSGEIGFWFRYDGGTSATRACAQISLQDNNANVIYFYSGNSLPPAGGIASTVNSTRTYQGLFGWCRAPVGYDIEIGAPAAPDTWYGPYPGAGFNWNRVTDMGIRYMDAAAATIPDEFEIDGLTLPFPALGFDEDAGGGSSQALYRIRPLFDNAPWLRHQLALEGRATQLLAHHKDSGIDLITLTTAGNRLLRYAGQSVTINIPSMGLNNQVCYLSKIHQIIEPYVDVSDGYGFDWVTEIEAVPINSIVYDMGRLRDGSLYSSNQLGYRAGVGLSVK